jgi:hypothetical protein
MARPKGTKMTPEQIQRMSLRMTGVRKAQCKKGHKTTEENTITYPNGQKRCKTCVIENRNDKEQNSKRRELGRALNARNKEVALTHYGPDGKLQCSWESCDIVDIDMLTLDHVHDNGAEHRREINGNINAGNTSYRWVKDNGFPSGFQTLCWNHQWKKQLERLRRARL